MLLYAPCELKTQLNELKNVEKRVGLPILLKAAKNQVQTTVAVANIHAADAMRYSIYTN